MEAAAALSHGETVLLVSPLQMSFLRHHPRGRSCESLAQPFVCRSAWRRERGRATMRRDISKETAVPIRWSWPIPDCIQEV